MSFKEILELKDEILKNNRDLEIRIKNQIENYNTQFSNNLTIFQKRINEINETNHKVVKSIPDINFQLSKINQIEKFDLRVDNRLSSHDLRITTILNEIEKIKTKYDKIVVDNLYVSGHIGGRCTFPNLSEYLLFNINEVNALKLDTEQLKRDTKNMKNKNDNTIKQVVNLIDGSVKRCNEYTDNKQKDFQLLLDTKMKEFNEKLMSIRMNVCKIQMKTEEEYNNLNIEFNKVLEEKKEFTNFFQNKLSSIQNEISKLQKDYKKNINNARQNNKNIENDIKKIKENLKYLLNLIELYQKKQHRKIIDKSFNILNMSSSDEKKNNTMKNNKNININTSFGSYFSPYSLRKNVNNNMIIIIINLGEVLKKEIQCFIQALA